MTPISPIQIPQNNTLQWSKPALGLIKVNWDAAVDHKNKVMGVGLIARDYLGNVRASSCSFRPYVSDPTIAEAIGAKEGMTLGRDMEFQLIVLEGDAQGIVLAVRHVDCLGRYRSIIADAGECLGFF